MGKEKDIGKEVGKVGKEKGVGKVGKVRPG